MYIAGTTPMQRLQQEVLTYLPRGLKSLSILTTTLASGARWSMDWNWLVPQFPALQNLTLYRTYFEGEFPASLSLLPQLVNLDLTSNRLNGTIPHHFFASLPQLQTFRVASNLLTGTFPWYGLENIVLIAAQNNHFTSWPSIAGQAKNLATVNLALNDLTQIPNDESFQAMSALAYLAIFNNPTLGGPVPQFWANHTNIASVIALNCGLQGSLPSKIRAPKLNTLSMGINRICGSLPDVAGPSSLNMMALPSNSLSGSIPTSWHNLTIVSALDLSFNYLDGTVPSPILSPISYNLANLWLNDNLFTGGLPDFTDFQWLNEINITNTNLDACAMNPHINTSDSTLVCSLTIEACLNCVDFFKNCTNSPCSNTYLPPPPAISPTATTACINLAPRPGPPPIPAPECTTPPPPGPFICLQGAWVSVGPISGGTITVSGGGTVVVSGNLTATESITITGANTQVIVNGCAYVGPGGIIIELTQQELQQLVSTTGGTSKTFLQSQCGTDLSTVTVTTHIAQGEKSCKKYKNQNDSTRGTLTLIFSVDNSVCNRNRNIAIAVPSVLGSVMVLAAAGAVGYAIWRKYVFKSVRSHLG